MQLMLGVMFTFIVIGLVSRRFGAAQQVLVTLAAVALAGVQFYLSRFL